MEGIEQAQELLQSTEGQLENLHAELEQQLAEITSKYDMINETLEEVEVRAISENIAVHLVGLAWTPINHA